METGKTSIELEHAIGFSGFIPSSVYFHPNGRDYVTVSGGCVVVCDTNDPHSQVFLRGHSDQISCLKISNSGALMASGQSGEDSDAIVWDFEKKKILFRLEEHDYGVACLDISPDEKLLVTMGIAADHRVIVWDLSNGMIVATVSTRPDDWKDVCWGGFERDIKRRPTHRYVFASVGKGLLSFWTMDPYSGELVSSRVGTGMQTREFTCLEFSADESRLFAGSTSGDFLVVDVRNLVAVSSVSVCSGGLHSLLVNSNGERVIVGGGDGTVTEHVEHDGEWVSTKRARFTGAVTSLSASAEGTEVIVGVSQGFIHRMRVTDFESILLSESHSGAVNSVCFPRGVSDRFATSSTDGTLRTWDMSDYATAMTSQRPQSHADVRVWPTCIAHISECVVSGWSDGKIHGFDVESGEHLWLVDNSHRDGVDVIRSSNNERFFVSGGRDGAVRVWDLRTRQMVVNLKEHVQPVTDLSVFSDDAHILSCARDKSILCWDLRSEKRIASYVQRMGGLNSIALARDETQFLSVGTERRVSLWDMRLPDPVKASPYSTGGEGVAIRVSHDGNYFAVGGTDEIVHVWDYRMFQPVSVGRGHSDGILDLEFSPDDRQLVSVGKDGCVFIWNVWHD